MSSDDDAWERWQALVAGLDQRQRIGLIGALALTPDQAAEDIDLDGLDDDILVDHAEKWSETHLAPTLLSIMTSARSTADPEGSLDRARAREQGLSLGIAASLMKLDGLEMAQRVVDRQAHHRFAGATVVDLPRVSIAFDGGRRSLKSPPLSLVSFDHDAPAALPCSFSFTDAQRGTSMQGVLVAGRPAGTELIAAGVRFVLDAAATIEVRRVPGAAEGSDQVAWVTDVVDAPSVRRTKRFPIHHDVRLQTAIGGALDELALAAQSIPLNALAQGVVRFKIACGGARVRADAPGSAPGAVLTSDEIAGAGGVPIQFSFLLRADAPGPVTVDLFLLLRDRMALHQSIELTADAVPELLPSIGFDVPAAFSSLDGRHLVTLPAPTASIEIDERGPFSLEVTVASHRQRVEPATGLGELADQAIRWRTRLVELSERYPPDAELALDDGGAALLGFAQIGAEIHRALFGHPDESGHEDLKQTARALAGLGTAARPLLQLFAEHLPLPWGVVYDGASMGKPTPATAAEVDPRCFWGHHFLIERIAKASLGNVPPPALLATPGAGALVPCINRHVDAMQGVEASLHQLAFFDALRGEGHALACAPAIETRADLEQRLRTDRGAARLLYFFCHGNAAATVNEHFFLTRSAPDVDAWLSLDADESEAERIHVAWLRSVRPAPLAGQPLVFLNACSTAEGDREFQSQFITQFMQRWNVRGLIGTDWKIPTVFADRFSRRLLTRFVRGGEPLGAALAATSDEFVAAGNPFPLIYAMYARPDLTVS